MGQFLVEIYALPGSLLSGNQHKEVGEHVYDMPPHFDTDTLTGDYASFFSWLKALPNASASDVADIDAMISGYEPD